MDSNWGWKFSAKSGDAQPYNLLGIPLIILRDKEIKIRVFHNVCSHRGFKLLDKPCTLKNVIKMSLPLMVI